MNVLKMRLLGFNYTKIYVEHFSNVSGELKINTNIDVVNIERTKPEFFKLKEELLSIKFKYILDYEPNIAKIELEGNVLLSLDSKTAREVLNMWEDKKIPDDFRISLFNLILRKSNLRAMQLEEEMNLPLHVPLPSLRKPDKEEK